MSNCDTCRFWTPDDDDWRVAKIGFRKCEAIRMTERIEEGVEGEYLTGDAREDAECAAIKAAKAFCVDGSSYYAAVYTAPDFGCVLHEIAT
jgi:hypothetical protein